MFSTKRQGWRSTKVADPKLGKRECYRCGRSVHPQNSTRMCQKCLAEDRDRGCVIPRRNVPYERAVLERRFADNVNDAAL